MVVQLGTQHLIHMLMEAMEIGTKNPNMDKGLIEDKAKQLYAKHAMEHDAKVVQAM